VASSGVESFVLDLLRFPPIRHRFLGLVPSVAVRAMVHYFIVLMIMDRISSLWSVLPISSLRMLEVNQKGALDLGVVEKKVWDDDADRCIDTN
jgi:hypothetical protein